MASLRQTDFSGGELGPLYYGRTDLPVFGKGCRTLKNFFVSRHGAALSRPGTTFVAKTKYPDPADPNSFSQFGYGLTRLIPFVVSDDVSFVLEVTNQAIRFYSRGATVLNGGVPYEVTQYTKATGIVATLPYTWGLFSQLTYAQIGDSLILCGPQAPPIELRRVTDTDWRARELDLSRPPPQYCDVSNPAQVTTSFAFVSATHGTHGTTSDVDHPAREWAWAVTALVQDPATGEKYETKADVVVTTWDGVKYDTSARALTEANAAVYLDKPVTLRRAETSALLTPVTLAVLGYNIYRGRGGLFGFMGTTTSREFIDTGAEPDYATQPPRGTNPFLVVSADGSTARIENPLAVTHFQLRRCFGGTSINFTPRRTSTVFASAVNDFFDFDEHNPIDVDSESLTIALGAYLREEIRHLVCLNKLMVGTNSSWWSINGGVGQPLQYNHMESEVVDQVGTSFVRPAIVDKALVFARTKGLGLRAILPGNNVYEAGDLSLLAHHLFTGPDNSVLDMAYAEDPWGMLWVVRSDGVLLSLTFVPGSMTAWTQHEVDGHVEAICTVPETDEDAVYMVVRRSINGRDQRYIERMTSRHARSGTVIDPLGNITTPTDYICLDAALPYVGGATAQFIGLDHLEGKQVYVIAEGQPVRGPFTVIGGVVQLGFTMPTNVDSYVGRKLVAYIGLPYVCDLELLDVAGGEARLKAKQVTHVGFEVNDTKGIYVGADFDHLTAVPERDTSDGFEAPALQTRVVKCPIKGKSDLSARACLRQALPLPCTVTGLTRKLAVGG